MAQGACPKKLQHIFRQLGPFLPRRGMEQPGETARRKESPTAGGKLRLLPPPPGFAPCLPPARWPRGCSPDTLPGQSTARKRPPAFPKSMSGAKRGQEISCKRAATSLGRCHGVPDPHTLLQLSNTECPPGDPASARGLLPV